MTLQRHLGGYAVTGLLQWLLEYAVMLAFSQWLMPVAAANVMGRICGAMLGFWLNGKWTFASQGAHVGRRALLRFGCAWLALTTLNTAIVSLLDQHAGLHAAQLFKPTADLLSGGLGFLLSRHWIYRR